jgi:transcriptional regulator with XRE-family HTH domain
VNRPEIHFGENLRRWHRLRGQTQSDVAARSGYSQRHISFLESSRSKPTRESVLVLAETLDVPVHARNELLLAAGFAPSYSAHALDSENLAAAVEALRSVLASSRPFPAMLIALRAWLERLEDDPSLATRSGDHGHDPVSILELRKDTLSVKLFTIVSTFEEPLDATLSDLRIETFFPADEETRAILYDIDASLGDPTTPGPGTD